MIIRPINLDKNDIDGLTRLMNEWDDLPCEILYDSIYEKVDVIKKKSNSEIFIAENDGEMVGYIFVTEVIFLGLDSFVEIQSILVEEKLRGIGIGKKLIDHAEEWTRKIGYNKLILSSRVQLERSHLFYKKLGFKITKQSYFFSKNV